MLPDLRQLKKELSARHRQYLRRQVGDGSFIEDLARQYVHEGDRTRMHRADGTVDETRMKEAVGEIEVKRDELPKLTDAGRKAKLDEVAEQMRGQIERHMVESISEVTEKYGQTVGRPGEKLSVETVFDAWEKIATDFDEHGNPSQLTFIGGEEANRRMQEIMAQIASDPELRKRRMEQIERKYREWREREADRKLVG